MPMNEIATEPIFSLTSLSLSLPHANIVRSKPKLVRQSFFIFFTFFAWNSLKRLNPISSHQMNKKEPQKINIL